MMEINNRITLCELASFLFWWWCHHFHPTFFFMQHPDYFMFSLGYFIVHWAEEIEDGFNSHKWWSIWFDYSLRWTYRLSAQAASRSAVEIVEFQKTQLDKFNAYFELFDIRPFKSQPFKALVVRNQIEWAPKQFASMIHAPNYQDCGNDGNFCSVSPN